MWTLRNKILSFCPSYILRHRIFCSLALINIHEPRVLWMLWGLITYIVEERLFFWKTECYISRNGVSLGIFVLEERWDKFFFRLFRLIEIWDWEFWLHSRYFYWIFGILKELTLWEILKSYFLRFCNFTPKRIFAILESSWSKINFLSCLHKLLIKNCFKMLKKINLHLSNLKTLESYNFLL